MKFTCTTEIECPQEKVAALFANPKYLKEYQDSFISKELLQGEEGKNGAVSRMLYKQGKGQMELTETILENNLPHSFLGHYHHKDMDNTMRCEFIRLGDSRTRYISEIEYTAFRGFMPKMMAKLFPGLFKKQVQKWLDSFKDFAENKT
ncbi:MAG: SRPBCC family protein [Flavobacteriaceae bacterium]|nr:SRPBCC family protein [Flavobacteriaceae bacterium]